MPAQKFHIIYNDLKTSIENGIYRPESALPTEFELVDKYGCSRNTVRRAIAELAKIGYVQSIRGKGVIVIYQGKAGSKEFSLGSIETMREAAERNHKTYRTKVEVFTTFPVDERISKRTGFDVGETVYYAQRVRFFDERPVILDNNWFLARIVKDLTPEICEKSVYQYMEHELGENIVTAKRVLTVEKATQVDRKYLDLRDFDCVAVVTSHTFNADGVMFEYTQSRHVPDQFAFSAQASR
ncbi:MAG: UTRA domain-containing protein [Chordicoccus sp.]